eukprot:6190231-Pleurochrysis_carterae.AAC.1
MSQLAGMPSACVSPAHHPPGGGRDVSVFRASSVERTSHRGHVGEAHERVLAVALVDRELTRKVASVPYPTLSERGTHHAHHSAR